MQIYFLDVVGKDLVPRITINFEFMEKEKKKTKERNSDIEINHKYHIYENVVMDATISRRTRIRIVSQFVGKFIFHSYFFEEKMFGKFFFAQPERTLHVLANCWDKVWPLANYF